MPSPVYVLDDEKLMMRTAIKVRSADEVRRAYFQKKHSVWFAPDNASLNILAKVVKIGKPRHALLAMKKVSVARRVLLDTLFAVVVEPTVIEMLASHELREVLVADNRQDLFVAARAVPEDDALVLFRGDLSSLIVPLSSFKGTSGGCKPNPKKVSVADYGQTICLGEYEIAADALLYEFDPEARRRAKRREIKTDDSIGAGIRRLRLQKRLSRGDFGSLSAKTIARIERGETDPRKSTLTTIAKTLGVDAAELATF
ncbi:MAG: helix-turn-helix transcriptional regulator [Deltaproteobacteria bacterium]|nr:helix-turn-helix transcriptional regulator [Deltaproteobacteria bacterium]